MEHRDKSGHKGHYCLYCKKKQQRLPRHLENKHKAEDLVQEALTFQRKSKKRNNIWSFIQRKGDYQISVERKKNSQSMLAVRRLTVNKSEEQLPCEFCYGIFKARKLSEHSKKCFMRERVAENTRKVNVVKSSRIMLSSDITDGHSQDINRYILANMQRDQYHLIIRTDKLLMAYGAIELEKKEIDRYHDVSYSLRVLAKLLCAYRELHDKENTSAKDLVLPENYDRMTNSVKSIAKYHGPRDIGNPHLILRAGYSLKTLAIIVKLENLKMGFQDMVDKMRCFAELYESDYVILANNARSEYDKRKGNAPEALPLEADVKLLREFCVREINNLINVEKLFQSDYVYLSKLIYTRLLTFNARRGGEPGKLTLTDWTMVENDRWKRKEDLERLVDPVERTLAERLKLCYIEGKKKKKGCFLRFFILDFFHIAF